MHIILKSIEIFVGETVRLSATITEECHLRCDESQWNAVLFEQVFRHEKSQRLCYSKDVHWFSIITRTFSLPAAQV